MNNFLIKFENKSKKDKKSINYDYLILNIDKKEEIEAILKYISNNKIEIDFYFFINTRFKKKRIYIQVSNNTTNLKKIHNFFRINFNKNISFKKASKHSVFFEGRNFLLTLKNNNKELFLPLSSIKTLNDYMILLGFNSDLLSVYKIEIEDEYKKLQN